MFRISSRFGQQESIRGHIHRGLDIAMPEGTKLKAVEEGTIHLADYGSVNSGKTVFIDTADGHKIIYGHLSKFNVSEGQEVHAGDVVGYVGDTGHSFGNHLHLGLKDSNNNFINPEKYVNNDGTLNIHFTKQPEMPDTSSCSIYTHKDPSELFNTAMEKFNDGLSEMATNFVDLFLQHSADTLGFIINLVLPFLF
ncbi:metallo-endopeptidase [Bacillus phage Eldridge]|uniref:Putative peptidase n=1 Tax=Bacillus phage Eldridge TaxID=1776293 RepID=A0A0Y0AH42_9CAUD|nr:metallo-endopeptidase [Bacillus phage Eldridge]AMB18768.1 putative peptidase [Bacillus phage Eldridge]